MPAAARPLATRVLGMLVVALLALGTAASVAAAQDPQGGVTITVKPPNGGQPGTVALADVDPDITTNYKLAKPDGGTEVLNTSEGRGVSVLAILKATQTDFNYSRITVPGPNGTSFTIGRDAINSVKPPLFFTDAQGVTRFIGAPDSSGVVPVDRQFEVTGALELVQESTSRLGITINPRKKKIALGGSVRFTAKVTGARADETLVYSWVLKTGGKGKAHTERLKATGASFTQKFPRKDGVYIVQVTAWVDGDKTNNQAAAATITVGNPKKGDKEREGSGDADSGGSGGSGGSSSGGGGTSYYGGGSSDYSSPSYDDSYTSVPTPPSDPAPEPEDPPELPDIATSGTTVEGNLLADASDAPPASLLDSAAKAAREGQQADDSDGGAGVPEAALSIAGVLALLGLGAGLEFREGKLPRLRVPKLPLPRRGA